MNNWLNQSIISALLLVPAWLSVGYFDRNLGVNSTTFLIWYLMGVVISSTLYTMTNATTLVPSLPIVLAIMLVGLTIGSVANILLFKAVTIAPNPGMPVAIVNTSSLGVFIAGALLYRWLPKYFQEVRADPWSLFGIIMTIVGVTIIVTRK